LQAAAVASGSPSPGISEEAIQSAIAKLSRADCDAFLLRLAKGEPSLSAKFNQKLSKSIPQSIGITQPQRTIQQLLDAAEEEEESQALLFAMMQEQHDKQIAAIMATNKSNMDAMMEQMNALVAGKGGGKGAATTQQNNKENIKPTDDNKDKKPTSRNKHLCPHCKLQVLHKAANCPELEENTHRRWKGWKSVNNND
jgi:hypothetical protein